MTGPEHADRIADFCRLIDDKGHPGGLFVQHALWDSSARALKEMHAGARPYNLEIIQRAAARQEALVATKAKVLTTGRKLASELAVIGSDTCDMHAFLDCVDGDEFDTIPAADAIEARRLWRKLKPHLQAAADALRAGRPIDREAPPPLPPDAAAAPGWPARKKGCAMSNESTRKAAALRKVAEALRAWGEFKSADSPGAREAARTALDLATHHLGIIMAASNAYGRHVPTAQALEWVQEAAAKRGRTDFGSYWCWWGQLTQPHLCGGPVPVGFPDDLDRWADKLDTAAAITNTGRERGADTAEPPKPELEELLLETAQGSPPATDVRNWAGCHSGTFAVVMTDIVNSVALNKTLGDSKMLKWKRAHFAKTERIAGKYGGCPVKTTGDGAIVLFHTAGKALCFALDAWARPGAPIPLHAVVHVGPLDIEPHDCHGDTVNFAERALKVAKKGGVVITARPIFDSAFL